MLKELASTLRTDIRRHDILARYGGEEFTLLLPEVGLDQAHGVAEKLRKLVEEHEFKFDAVVMPITVSIGVAIAGPDTPDVKGLLRIADEKLYEAKKRGRNRVVV